MPTLPAELLPLIVNFQPLFSKSVWENAQTLLVGAILAIGNRTVTACLRVTGNGRTSAFKIITVCSIARVGRRFRPPEYCCE